MADYGTVVLNTPVVYEATSFVPTPGIAFVDPTVLNTVGTTSVGSYALAGTAPCPDAPLVGQWWPR